MSVSILPINRAGTSVAIKESPGDTNLLLMGHSNNILTTEPPHLLWDLKTAYPFQTSAVTLEIVSSSVNDTSIGTGATTVLVETLDNNYVEQTQVVTLNGTTPVILTGTHRIVQFVTVISSGSSNKNEGNITVRVPGPGDIQGYISTNTCVQRAFKFTTPARKTAVIDNLYLNSTTPTGTSKVVTLDFMLRLEDGTILNTQTNYFHGSSILSITLPTGFVVPEKTTVYAQITSVDANGGNFALSGSGGIFTNI